MTELLPNVPWFLWKAGALAFLLGAALEYLIALRTRSRLHYTACVSFFLTGAMLAVHPHLQDAREGWAYGFVGAESVCAAIGIGVLVVRAWARLRVRMRRRRPMPMIPVSGPERERVGVAAGRSGEEAVHDGATLVPVRYRFSGRGSARLTWRNAAGGEDGREVEISLN